jgi:hypothetical protein
VQHALKKQIITAFESMHLDIGFANISAHETLDHLFMTYGNITAVYLEHNFEQMRWAWDPQQPMESLFKQIQDCANFYEAGGIIIRHPQQKKWATPIYLPLGTLGVPATGGIKSQPLKNLGAIQGTLLCCTPVAQANAG